MAHTPHGVCAQARLVGEVMHEYPHATSRYFALQIGFAVAAG
jgi:hypothetical protein